MIKSYIVRVFLGFYIHWNFQYIGKKISGWFVLNQCSVCRDLETINLCWISKVGALNIPVFSVCGIVVQKIKKKNWRSKFEWVVNNELIQSV